MCGRYDLSETPQRLKDYFGLQDLPTAFNNRDVRPTDWTPVIRDVGGIRKTIPGRGIAGNNWKQCRPAWKNFHYKMSFE